jgi:glucose repression mediator protein
VQALHYARTNLCAGSLSEQMNDFDGAMQCYEQALKFNQWSVPAMVGIACILRTKDAFPAAVEYLRTILKVDPANGDVWGSLGECWNVALSETMN